MLLVQITSSMALFDATMFQILRSMNIFCTTWIIELLLKLGLQQSHAKQCNAFASFSGDVSIH